MSKKKKLRQANEEIFSTKVFFVKYFKRYGIMLAIVAPFLFVGNYILSKNVSWYNGVLPFFVNITILLLACFISLVIFTKKDDRKKAKSTAEDERDPFAD